MYVLQSTSKAHNTLFRIDVDVVKHILSLINHQRQSLNSSNKKSVVQNAFAETKDH